MFYTLYDFMIYTESITYVFLGCFLIFIVYFWCFLTEKETKNKRY